MQRSKMDILVGVLVMLGLAALVFLSLKAANLLQVNWHQSGYEVRAYFDDIGGLRPNASVRSSGVTVGKVKTIGYDDSAYRAVVVLELQDRYKFSEDSSLKILTSGLLGDQYLGLEPGYEDKNLQNGDTIAATQSAMVLENLIANFMFSKAAEPAEEKNNSTKATTTNDNDGAY